MRACSRFALPVVVASALAFAPLAARAAEPDVLGKYDCVGDAGGGQQYHGKVEITKEGDCYIIKWQIGDRQSYTGLGVIESNTLSAAIRDDHDEKYMAVIAYRMERGGKLAGHWSVFGSGGKTYTETLSPVK